MVSLTALALLSQKPFISPDSRVEILPLSFPSSFRTPRYPAHLPPWCPKRKSLFKGGVPLLSPVQPDRTKNLVQIYRLIPVTLPSSFTAHVTRFHRILDVLSDSGYTSNHAACGSPPGISGVEEVGELRILFDVLCRNFHHVIVDSAEELPFVRVKDSAESRVDS
jgi:hypothetical protein